MSAVFGWWGLVFRDNGDPVDKYFEMDLRPAVGTIVYAEPMQPRPVPRSNSIQRQQSAKKPPPEVHCCTKFAITTSYTFITVLYTVAAVVLTVAFTVSLSSTTADFSSHMLVLTGRRTRDWSTANSYSMSSAEEDQYTRLYVCMKASGVTVPGESIASIGDFRETARAKHDCGMRSDGGWPRDYGFLRCMQANFNASFHQSNVFLKCLDLSEGIMVEAIQTPASTLFLGSYNFVAFLLASMAVISGFLLFTAGGWCSEFGLHTDMRFDQETNSWVPTNYNYVAARQLWAPLAALPVWLAFFWSLFVFAVSMFYTFPTRNAWSDAMSLDGGASSFPATPWTGYMCAGVSLGMSIFFASCLAEWYADRGARRAMSPTTAPVQAVDQGISPAIQVLSPVPGAMTSIPPTYVVPNPTYGGPVAGAGVWDNPFTGPAIFPANDFTRTASRFRNHRRPNLGVRYNKDLFYEDHALTHIAPLLNKAFAMTWVFADGLLILGMLNSQNSLLNENVVTIWYYTVLCRAFQLAAAYFMDDALFADPGPKTSEDANATDTPTKLQKWSGVASQVNSVNNFNLGFLEPQNLSFDKTRTDYYLQNNLTSLHAGIAVVCCHLSSLWCLLIVLYHFFTALSIPYSLNTAGVSNPIHSLQLIFVIYIIAMDVFKHIVAFLAVWGYLDQKTYLTIIQTIFTADWIGRSILITATAFTVPQYLGNNNKALYEYID